MHTRHRQTLVTMSLLAVIAVACGPDSSVAINAGEGIEDLAVGESEPFDRMGIESVDESGLVTVNVPFGEACDAEEVEVETWIRSPDLLVIDVSWRELGDCSQDYSPTTRPVEFRPDPGLR